MNSLYQPLFLIRTIQVVQPVFIAVEFNVSITLARPAMVSAWAAQLSSEKMAGATSFMGLRAKAALHVHFVEVSVVVVNSLHLGQCSNPRSSVSVTSPSVRKVSSMSTSHEASHVRPMQDAQST